jgi:hypothetical protein
MKQLEGEDEYFCLKPSAGHLRKSGMDREKSDSLVTSTPNGEIA